MEATIVNFRLGRHTKSEKQMVVRIKTIKNREQANKLKDKKVTWKTSSGKIIKGIVKAPHGNSGAFKVAFERGMPGQAVGTKVEIE
jgi:ribosomal protein L35AE/L33A